MSQPTHKAILLEPPAGAESEFHDDSTLDQDVFDGIEDIYMDLEATPPPPPPPSKEDIVSQMANTSTISSSDSSASSTSSVGINKVENLEGEDETRRHQEPGFPYACGVPQNTAKLANMWNTFANVQSYFEIPDEKPKDVSQKTANNNNNNQNTQQPVTPARNDPTHVVDHLTPPKNNVPVDNSIMEPGTEIERQPTDSEMKTKIFTEEDMPPPSAPVGRDTIINYKIAQLAREQSMQKPSLVDRFKENAHRFKGKLAELTTKKEASNDSNDVDVDDDDDEERPKTQRFLNMLQNRKSNSKNANTSTEEDEESKIRMKKMKQYQTNFWSILGEQKTCGVSRRLLLLIGINLFGLMLLIVLITQFTGRRNALKAQQQQQATLAPTTNVQDDNKWRAFCNKEGVTKEDGIILKGNQAMENGEFFCSPSKTYIIGMTDDLAIANVETNQVIWMAGVTGGARTVLLEDGSMIIQDERGDVIWSSGAISDSTGYYNHQLVFWEDHEGVIALQQTPTLGVSDANPYNFWMAGDPQYGKCTTECPDLEFPVRGTFYYPNFDGSERAWQDINGNLPLHFPSMGFYSSSDPSVIMAHVEAMDYGNIDLGIAFWLGAGTNYDRSRILMLLDESSRQNANLKWTISYELEQLEGAVNQEQIDLDLKYLRRWFAGHESWARVDGKPVLYVHNVPGCRDLERWTTGAAADWFVVLRVFNGYENCPTQPDSWYDQSINDNNDGIDVEPGLYHSLAPGHWVTGRRRPNLERLSPREWCENVLEMEESTTEPWHFINSFNDRNRGSAIEPSLDWRSDTRYGFFLDCLHDPQMFLA